MKRLLPAMLVLLTGCGGTMFTPSTTQQPKYERMPPAVANPSVLIVGDSIVNAWCSATLLAQNPKWACQGSPAGVREETTTQVLARFPSAISVHPKTIVIEAGIWDMLASSTQIGVSPCDTTENSCTNIQQMITEATNAGIYVIVCTIPPWGSGAAASALDSPDAESDINHVFVDVPAFNAAVMATMGATHVDMNSALVWGNQGSGDDYYEFFYVYNPMYTDDGVDPNTAGGQVMTQALQKALASPSVKPSRE